MSQKFKFNILTGDNAQDKYDAITTKEPFTFYLLQTGTGYLGTKKLFDSSDNTVTLTGKFFRAVKSHTITQDDLDNEAISKPEGTEIGNTGIIFTADNNEDDDGDEKYFFVPITINTIDHIDPDDPGDDVPTASAVVTYVMSMLEDKVSFEVDGEAGVETADGGISFPSLYSEEEVRIGTWLGKPLYRRIFQTSSPSVVNQEATIATLPYNIELKNIYGITKDIYNGIIPVNFYYKVDTDSVTYYVSCFIRNNVNIAMTISNSIYASRPVTVVLEYTKTTD